MARKRNLTPLVVCWDGKLRTAIDGKYGDAYGLALRTDGTVVAIPDEEFVKLMNVKSSEEVEEPIEEAKEN